MKPPVIRLDYDFKPKHPRDKFVSRSSRPSKPPRGGCGIDAGLEEEEHMRNNALLSMLGLLLMVVSLSGTAFAKDDILIVNNAPDAKVVRAFSPADPLRIISCQNETVGTGKTIRIKPDIASGLNKLTQNHCGNFENLAIVVSWPGASSSVGLLKAFDHVRWGATIVINSVSDIVCNRCKGD